MSSPPPVLIVCDPTAGHRVGNGTVLISKVAGDPRERASVTTPTYRTATCARASFTYRVAAEALGKERELETFGPSLLELKSYAAPAAE